VNIARQTKNALGGGGSSRRDIIGDRGVTVGEALTVLHFEHSKHTHAPCLQRTPRVVHIKDDTARRAHIVSLV